MPRPVSYDYNKRTGILSGAQRKREGESNLANQEQKSICREIGARTGGDIYTVSYTHLTLPTILRV